MAVIFDNPASVEEDARPQAASLKLQAFPNPFRQRTIIRYSLPKPGKATVSVVDIAGRTVIQGRFASQSAGSHEFVWNGRTAGGKSVPAGVYLVRVEAGGGSSSARLVLSR
jgi:flagellar hook assembly protein FlgD